MLAVLLLLVVGTLVFAVMSGMETEWKMYSILAVVFASIATIITIVFIIYYFATSKSLDKFTKAYNARVDAIGKAMTEAARRARATGQAIIDFPGVQFNKAVMNVLQNMSPEQQAAFIDNAVKNGKIVELVNAETKAALASNAVKDEAKSAEAQREEQKSVEKIVAALPPPPSLQTGPAFEQQAAVPAAAATAAAVVAGQRP